MFAEHLFVTHSTVGIKRKDIVIVSAAKEPENSFHIENSIWPAVVVLCFLISTQFI